jgi:phage pi2 protein 07
LEDAEHVILGSGDIAGWRINLKCKKCLNQNGKFIIKKIINCKNSLFVKNIVNYLLKVGRKWERHVDKMEDFIKNG